jgi:hypothetical protein
MNMYVCLNPFTSKTNKHSYVKGALITQEEYDSLSYKETKNFTLQHQKFPH